MADMALNKETKFSFQKPQQQEQLLGVLLIPEPQNNE
jgi:hypothetical protein